MPATVAAPATIAGWTDLAHQFGVPDSIPDRRLDLEPLAVTHEVAHGRFQSPLRYPGAKSAMAPLIGRILRSAQQSATMPTINLLVEPFAGGASASLRMIGDGIVDRILLADADPLVTAFWQAAAEDTEQLIDRMQDEWTCYVAGGGQRAVDRWDYWRSWQPAQAGLPRARRLDTATKCLFLNRTTFSGILHGKAGPIGGRKQHSAYPINCRWNSESLAERIRYVGHLYNIGRLVDVWRKDWRQTLEDVPEHYPQLIPSRVVAYLDPPYVEKSSKLYRASFDPNGGYGAASTVGGATDAFHLDLADYLRKKAQFRWLLSYDNHPVLTQSPWMYAASQMSPSPEDRELLGVRRWQLTKRLVSTRYTASGSSGKRTADELLITTLPRSTVPIDDQLRLLPDGGEPSE